MAFSGFPRFRRAAYVGDQLRDGRIRALETDRDIVVEDFAIRHLADGVVQEQDSSFGVRTLVVDERSQSGLSSVRGRRLE